MVRTYNAYTKNQLLNSPKIPIEIFRDNSALYEGMADEMIGLIKKHNENGLPTVFICPVGPTGHYQYFVEKVNKC